MVKKVKGKINDIIGWVKEFDRYSILKLVKLVVSIVLIVLPFLLGWYYVLGFVLGLTVMGYVFLDPSPVFIMTLRKMFGLDLNNSMVYEGVINEYEKQEQQRPRSGFKVRYNKTKSRR